MKKIIFKMMIALFVLSLAAVSCKKEPVELNNPDRAAAPMPATMTVTGTTDSTVTLVAVAELAETFLWQRGGARITGQTASTFVLRATGLFPDQAIIRVAGENPSGTGFFATADTFNFTPWRVPSKATIQGESNVCPVQVVRLTASAVPATQFIWYRGGVVVDTTNVPTRTVRASGTYTVRGINSFGDGELSEPLDIVFTECEPFIIEGAWSATGRTMLTPAADIEWRDTIMADTTQLGIDAGAVFMTTRFGNAGFGSIAGRIRIFEDEDGDFYTMLSFRHPGMGSAGHDGIIRARGVMTGEYDGFVWNFNVAPAGNPGRIYLDVSSDQTMFRLSPQALWSAENEAEYGPLGGIDFGYAAIAPGAADNADGAGWFNLVRNPTWTRDTPAAAPVNLENIEWIPSRKQSTQIIGKPERIPTREVQLQSR